MFDLHGMRVLIAGGSSGVGLSTAKLLIHCGATVVVNGRDRSKLESVKKQLGVQASIAAFDAANPQDRTRGLADVGSFDHLVVALSGGKGAGPFAQVTQADLRSGFETNSGRISRLLRAPSLTLASPGQLLSSRPYRQELQIQEPQVSLQSTRLSRG